MKEPKRKRTYTRKPDGFNHQSSAATLERQHKRRQDELAIAQKYGFDSASTILTVLISGEYILIKNPEKVTNAEIT